jgi:putative phosphoribosyl transferase
MVAIFQNRMDAGRLLARKLTAYANRPDVLVLGLPRGGVPVAFEVAKALNLPLDVFVVRKLGLPGQEELAMGAIATGGVRVLNDEVVKAWRIPDKIVEEVTREETEELERRELLYRSDRPALDVGGHTVILVDDGIATGMTMFAAIAALQQQGPERIIVAVPVAAPETCAELREKVTEVVCLMMPSEFYAISLWYKDFSQTSNEEVRDLLKQSLHKPSSAP